MAKKVDIAVATCHRCTLEVRFVDGANCTEIIPGSGEQNFFYCGICSLSTDLRVNYWVKDYYAEDGKELPARCSVCKHVFAEDETYHYCNNALYCATHFKNTPEGFSVYEIEPRTCRRCGKRTHTIEWGPSSEESPSDKVPYCVPCHTLLTDRAKAEIERESRAVARSIKELRQVVSALSPEISEQEARELAEKHGNIFVPWRILDEGNLRYSVARFDSPDAKLATRLDWVNACFLARSLNNRMYSPALAKMLGEEQARALTSPDQ